MTRLISTGATVLAVLASTAAAAPEQLTLEARPTVLRGLESRVTFLGSVASGRAGDLVTIEAKQCGLQPPLFRGLTTARTEERGLWSVATFLSTTAVVRATWNGATSAEVTVRKRPYMSLRQRSARLFNLNIGALVPFRGKRVTVERYDRRLGSWVAVKKLALGEQFGASGGGANFRVVVPKGTLIRAVLPRSQASPCYLAGYSNLLRT